MGKGGGRVVGKASHNEAVFYKSPLEACCTRPSTLWPLWSIEVTHEAIGLCTSVIGHTHNISFTDSPQGGDVGEARLHF